jgi:hypothetical protein
MSSTPGWSNPDWKAHPLACAITFKPAWNNIPLAQQSPTQFSQRAFHKGIVAYIPDPAATPTISVSTLISLRTKPLTFSTLWAR